MKSHFLKQIIFLLPWKMEFAIITVVLSVEGWDRGKGVFTEDDKEDNPRHGGSNFPLYYHQ